MITVTDNRDLEIKVSILVFNEMCSPIRRTLNNKIRKDTPIKFYEAMTHSSLKDKP
jgi:hypothetical protein